MRREHISLRNKKKYSIEYGDKWNTKTEEKEIYRWRNLSSSDHNIRRTSILEANGLIMKKFKINLKNSGNLLLIKLWFQVEFQML